VEVEVEVQVQEEVAEEIQAPQILIALEPEHHLKMAQAFAHQPALVLGQVCLLRMAQAFAHQPAQELERACLLEMARVDRFQHEYVRPFRNLTKGEYNN
jgi:hypothetical protein